MCLYEPAQLGPLCRRGVSSDSCQPPRRAGTVKGLRVATAGSLVLQRLRAGGFARAEGAVPAIKLLLTGPL